MSRKQASLPGMGRPAEDPDIIEATDRFCEARSEKKRETKRLAEVEKQRATELELAKKWLPR